MLIEEIHNIVDLIVIAMLVIVLKMLRNLSKEEE